MLAELALSQFAERHRQRPKKLSHDAMVFLQSQRWPGNVRQLMHTVERAAIFSDSDLVEPADFGIVDADPADTLQPPMVDPGDGAVPAPGAAPQEQMRVSNAVGQVEEQLIRQAMVKYHGNKKRVALELGISRSYLYKRLAQMGFGADEAEP
jgi:DNA-binding NtrC family response regulator